jgi:hypothetical protein
MNPVDDYLAQSYRRDVLGTQNVAVAPWPTPEMIADVKARIVQIDALRLGATLASRDYVSYQNRRALIRLLAEWEKSHL